MDDDKAFHLSSVGQIQYLGVRVLSVLSRMDKTSGNLIIVTARPLKLLGHAKKATKSKIVNNFKILI